MHLLVKGLLFVIFCSRLLCASGADAESANTPIARFSSHDKAAPMVLKELAYQAHVVIGISGFVSGSAEDKLISIDVDDPKPLGEVLKELSRQDPDFKWQQFNDGSIHVERGARPLTLINVLIKDLTIDGSAMANSALSLFLRHPEILTWERATGCRLGHPIAIVGNPQQDNVSLPQLQINDAPLWKVFNELSAKTQRYFWSAIGSAPGSSCYVDVNLLNR